VRIPLAVAVALAAVIPGPATAVAAGPDPAAQAVAEPASMVRRTTLIVHDIDASIRFYRDVLGFELWLENRGKVTPSSLPSEAPVGAPSRFAIMKGRHPWIGMVGLLQYGEPRPAPPPPKALRPRDAVLMIETEDLDGIWARMQRAGTPIHKRPQTSEVTGAGGARWQATFLFAFDPDGHMLEINERRPAATATTGDGAMAAAIAVRVRRGFFEGRFGQLHYRRTAPVQALGMRPPLVLLHQSPLSGRMFSELLPALGSDRVVLAPDTPGYGESDAPPRVPALADYGDALHDLIADLKEPVDLVGYHTGALIAADIAARYPRSVRRLVLISVPVFTAERRAGLNTTTVQAEDGSHLLGEWKSTMSVRPPGQSLEQAARIVAEKQRAGLKAGWAMSAIAGQDPEPLLRAIARPTLIIRPRDGLWDAGAQAASWIPGARLEDAPQWGFGLFDAYPLDVAASLRRFLDAT
jgi:pimeloyl-ACP methyl ester carboxylesterase